MCRPIRRWPPFPTGMEPFFPRRANRDSRERSAIPIKDLDPQRVGSQAAHTYRIDLKIHTDCINFERLVQRERFDPI